MENAKRKFESNFGLDSKHRFKKNSLVNLSVNEIKRPDFIKFELIED